MPQQVSPAAPFFPCAHRAGGDDSHFAMRRILNAAVLPGGLALAVVLRAAVPFPQADSDLRADPAARYGALPNGLRYVVLPNHEPKQRASMRLLVLAGSFGETESQRGLAHFLEHMAFNGSTHYAAGALAEKLRRLGMGAGADSNASTSFDRTVYQLELPDTAAATLADGLRILADYAGGLLIEPALVEKERGVILGEKRTRDTVGYRTLVAQLGFIEAGTRVPDRLPLGLDSVCLQDTIDCRWLKRISGDVVMINPRRRHHDSPLKCMIQAKNFLPLRETADSSGLKPLGMTKIKGFRWRT